MPKPPKVSWELNLGHLLTAVGLACSAFITVSHFEARLAEHEIRIAQLEKTIVEDRADRSQWEQRALSTLMDVQSRIGELRGEVNNRASR